jgi:parallel beta helix pectate lyase-like protein
MSITVRSSLFTMVIIAVLIFSAIGPTIVYADGGTSTDTPPTETARSPKETAKNAGNCSKSLDSSKTSNADSSKCKWATGSGNSTNTGGETTSSPSWTEVPNNTTVTVLNATGQPQPLTTQGAADAIATTSDPIWCPAGQSPTPGANGCTQSFSSFSALLTFLAGNATYQGAGTIYVQQGAYTGGESSVNFNNYNLSNISNNNLTIQGGWNTSTNTVDLTSTSTFNNTAIIIGSSTNPWAGSLTINNLTLNFNPTGQSGTGLTLNSQTDINISNVTVMNSATGAGAELNAGGDVNIDNSHFDRNKTAGAIIRAKGNVAISSSSFSNPANGRRQVTGLDIVTDGSVSLFDVLANENREIGATINAGGPVAISASVNPFTGTATTSFSGTKIMQGSTFLGYGLQVETPSDIAITNVAANDNFLWGAALHAGGNVNISDSIFNANTTASPGFMDDTGLIVTSGGVLGVNINHIEANDNRLIGATITATHDVSILNSFFNNNNGVLVDSVGTQTFHGEGLQVVSGDSTQNILGNITLTNVDASNNTLIGAHLEANGDVTISGSTFSNNTSSNNPTGPAPTPLGSGLEIITDGNVFLTNVTASGNELNGAEVQGNCTMLIVTGGTYSNNGQYGLSVVNASLTQFGSIIFGGNTAGDIFQDPGTCVFTPATSPTPPTPAVDSTGSTRGSGAVTSWNTGGYASLGNPFSTGMAVRSSTGFSTNLATITLNSFLANTRLANGSYISLFMGKYAYIYSQNGMQIVMYLPTLNSVAMVGPH